MSKPDPIFSLECRLRKPVKSVPHDMILYRRAVQMLILYRGAVQPFILYRYAA